MSLSISIFCKIPFSISIFPIFVQYMSSSILLIRYRYGYFSNCPYRYRYRYFPNFLIDIFIDIDIFQIFLSIFFRYRYSQNKYRYFIDISKKADISTIDIDISPKKHEKLSFLLKKMDFLPKMSLSISISISIFSKMTLSISISISIFSRMSLSISISISIFL